jgi:hypothetical protein
MTIMTKMLDCVNRHERSLSTPRGVDNRRRSPFKPSLEIAFTPNQHRSGLEGAMLCFDKFYKMGGPLRCRRRCSEILTSNRVPACAGDLSMHNRAVAGELRPNQSFFLELTSRSIDCVMSLRIDLVPNRPGSG